MPGGSKDAGRRIGLFGADQNQESTWLKRSTASAPTTPAAKQIATRWLSVVFEPLSIVLVFLPCVSVRSLLIPDSCNRSAGWLPSGAKIVFIDESPFGLDQVNRDIDVPSRRFGVRARLVRAI